MTTLIWNCFSGIAGNMAVASLLDLGADREKLKEAIASMDFSEGPVELLIEEKLTNGIRGIYFNTVDDHEHEHHHDHEHEHAHAHNHKHGHHHHDHEHDHGHHHENHDHHHAPHRGMKEIRHLIEHADLSANAREIALSCFEELAKAEAEIHGKSVDEVHFHEVGARDSIADLVGTAVCLDDLGITEILTTPVHLGSGMIKCAHGLIPVPAPATALLLKGYQVVIDTNTPFELTTPTGAAILKGLNARPLDSESLAYDKVGHGLGSREIGRPNFLRAFLTSGQAKKKADLIVEFSTNLDNVSGELLGHAASQIMAAGALDFTIVAATMKKGRPGHVLTVIAAPENAEAVETTIFDELPTLGLRKATIERTVLDRRSVEIETTTGKARAKEITELDGSKRTTIEFDEKARIAAQNHRPVRTLKFD